uniref:LOC495238 protein n=1 Tax=Xenopus laevis TaxID=8355 RepID=Q5XG11_XENLA|nr:LOC495238 protein [Xenopus laevis]
MVHTARLSRRLCSAGGSMELGQLGHSLGLNGQQLERLVEVEEGRSLVLRVQEGDQKVAVYRSDLRLCQTPKCAGDCGQLHLCRFYILGSCNRSPCKFNHCIRNAHNLSVLQKFHLDSMPIDELRQLLLQNDPNLLPDICSHYNRGDGPHGSCTYKNKCNKLHVCQHFLQGDCKFGEKCKRCHDLSEEETLKKLTKWQLSDSLLPGLLETYTNAHTLKSSCDRPPRNVVKSAEKKTKPGPSKSGTSQEIEEICLYFIRNSCSFKEKCVREHFHLPYRWQVYTNGTWKDLDNMEMIEKSYCDPNSRAVLVNLDFEAMTYQSNKVKRLSTPSSASKPPHFVFTTDWKWYWMDEYNKWVEYGTESDRHANSTICSSDLENFYQSNQTADVKFKAGKHKYSLSFKNMVQRNLQYETKRRVCRRPVFVSGKDVKKKRSSTSEPSKEDKNTPEHWDKGQTPDLGYKLVLLSPLSEEYSKIEAMFCRTLRTIRIHSIERIQNLALWEVYQW